MDNSGRNRLAIKRGAVMAYEDAPILVTRIGGDGTDGDKSTVNFARIKPDGTLGHGGHFTRYGIDVDLASGKLRHIDFAEVKTTVKLPAAWEERNREMAVEAAAARAANKVRRHDDSDEGEEHPSYGTVTVSRSSGGSGRLVGSPFEHQYAISLSIQRATKHRSLSNDRMHPGGPVITEIRMSEAQFARLITSVGNGEGTPCTLCYVGNEAMAEPPAEKETEKFHADTERAMASAGKGLVDAIEKVRALLQKPSVTKKDREEILSHLFEATRVYKDSLPWVVQQFDKRMEKIVSAGKHEIDAYLQSTVQRLGLAAVAAAPVVLALTGGEEKK